ncbi:MAG: hypothetical protein IPM00_18900 [Tetrasphaera sp.]|nr:hypothetical protein [Tetrasphaera sp.]
MPVASVLVTGTSGGLGSSTLASAVARGIGEVLHPSVLIDLDAQGGGLDVTCGIEHVDGLRWADLAAIQGPVPPQRLVDALPGPPSCKVLSAGVARPGSSLSGHRSATAHSDVLASIGASDRVLVADLPRHRVAVESSADPWAHLRPTVWVLLVGTRTRGLADLDSFLHGLESSATPGRETLVAVTGGPAPVAGLEEAIARHTGIPVIASVPWRTSVTRSAERGDWPRGDAHTAVVRAICRRLPEARAA